MPNNDSLRLHESNKMAALRQRIAELEEREREQQLALEVLRRLEEELRESEEKWRTVGEAVPDFILLYDRQGTILFINRILPGYRSEEVIGRSTYDFLPAEFHEPQREALERLFDTGEPYELEVMGAGQPGEVRWYANRGRPIYRGGQVVAALQVSTDITRRKRNEARIEASLREKESLLQEIHHRVKNNLQVISSLLSLQADQLPDPQARAAFRDSCNRVRAMAVLHERLYRSGRLDRIDFGRQVEALCSNLFCSYGIDANRVRLELQLAEVWLDIERAMPCGLLLNELVSNALKHAFPVGRQGYIRVTLDTGPNGQYTLIVADNGVGLSVEPDSAHTSSLGLQLVETLVRQLGGQLAMDLSEGTAFRITFPV